MTHRNRSALAAVLAAALLILSSASVMAFGGPGKPDNRPSMSPLPSGVVQPTHQAKPSQSLPDKSKGNGKGGIDCSNLPTPSPSAAAQAVASQSTAPKPGSRGQSGTTWGWRMGADWLRDLDPKNVARCSDDSLVKGIDNRIEQLIDTLNDAKTLVGKIQGLDSTQQAALNSEIDGAIGDLQALKTKIDNEPQGSDKQADLKTLQQKSVEVRAIVLQVRLLDSVEGTLAKLAVLDQQETALEGQLAAPPSGAKSDQAQKFLDDMKARIADAKKLATPLPGTLLGLTAAQLQAGKADPTIAAAIKANWQATFDVFKATQDGRMVNFFLTGSF
jgi:hypothetical protein